MKIIPFIIGVASGAIAVVCIVLLAANIPSSHTEAFEQLHQSLAAGKFVAGDSEYDSVLDVKPASVFRVLGDNNVEYSVYKYATEYEILTIYFIDNHAHSASYTGLYINAAESWYFHDCQALCEHISMLALDSR